MPKWVDHMMNWGFLGIPIVIALVVFLLGRVGCREVPTKAPEPVVKNPITSMHLQGSHEQTLLRG